MRSIALSFRIEANFQALNNEGAGGANVMEPRRIAIGANEYDGVSGEMVRRHILENFVRLCQAQNPSVPLHNRCAGLVPDRGKQSLIDWMKKQNPKLKNLEAMHYPSASEKLLKDCALCDIGGFLLALEQRTDNVAGVLKRDSCFEVGWLISEHPQIVNFAQHAAYHETQEHNLFVQNIRAGIYAGVMRVDIDRIGFNDWWWLGDDKTQKYAVEERERKKRVKLLLEAIEQFLLSLSGAKTAGWLPHPSGLLEGVIVTSSSGPAPFASPIRLSFDQNNNPSLSRNPDYLAVLENLQKHKDKKIELHKFSNPAELAEKMSAVRSNFEDATKKET